MSGAENVKKRMEILDDRVVTTHDRIVLRAALSAVAADLEALAARVKEIEESRCGAKPASEPPCACSRCEGGLCDPACGRCARPALSLPPASVVCPKCRFLRAYHSTAQDGTVLACPSKPAPAPQGDLVERMAVAMEGSFFSASHPSIADLMARKPYLDASRAALVVAAAEMLSKMSEQESDEAWELWLTRGVSNSTSFAIVLNAVLSSRLAALRAAAGKP